MAHHIPMHGNRKGAAKKKPEDKKVKAKAKASASKRRRPVVPVASLTNNEIALGAVTGLPFFVVFDLDGCISDDAWRFQFVQEHEDADIRFQHYHACLHLDRALDVGLALLKSCAASGMFPVFITARPNVYRDATVAWLGKVAGLTENKDCAILMRDNGDHRSTVDIKRDLFDALVAEVGAGNIVAAYDDREDVITMYNADFGVNAYVLDKHGVRDPLKLQANRMRTIAPAEPEPELHTAHMHESMEAAVKGTSEALRTGAPLDSVKWGDAFANIKAHTNSGPDESGPKAQSEPANAIPNYDGIGANLRGMAETFEQKNAQYGSNAIKVGDVMQVLFPNGITVNSAADHRMHHLFQLIIVKLTRFVNTDMKHVDSIHDMGVYCAMVEAEVDHHNLQFKR